MFLCILDVAMERPIAVGQCCDGRVCDLKRLNNY